MSTDLPAAARRILPLIDLTSLNDAQDDDVAALCAKARTPAGEVAAVCTWPHLIAEARRHLQGSGIRLATVANFPDGGAVRERAVAESRAGLEAGAEEIDMVLPYRAWLAGERRRAREVIAAVKAAVEGRARLKVILESGALGPAARVAAAARDAIDAGADFIKTSTGKTATGATPTAAEAMLEAIRDSGRTVGFKASGGIRTTAQAAAYLELAERILGPDWATPERFRIGASGLLDDVLAALGQSPGGPRDESY